MNPLFACVRAARPTPVVVELAREFSPRWQRQGPGCVVCDVSGLERLLGEPAVIGAEATGTTLLRPATRAGQDAARQRHERAFDMARRWGVTTIGAFAALDAGELSARMGQEGLR